MKNIFVSISAFLVAFIGNIVGWHFSFFIIFFTSLYIFGLLLYNAQMLPEFIMTYLDNKLIQDNELIKDNKTSIQEAVNSVIENGFLATTSSPDEKKQAYHGDYLNEQQIESLLNLILGKSKELNVHCQGINDFSTWAKNVNKLVVEQQANNLLKKISEVAGISDNIILTFMSTEIGMTV